MPIRIDVTSNGGGEDDERSALERTIKSDRLYVMDTRPDHSIRLVCVKCSPHTNRAKYAGGSTGAGSDGILRIATNLLDVPAEIIGLIFSFRWQIEIFFRFFKHILGCRHLLSHNA